MFKYLIIISLFFTSCSFKNHTLKDKNKYVSIIDYGNFSKDAVLNAAKKAFYFTNKDIVVDSYRNSISARKTVFDTLSTNIYKDLFVLEVHEKNNNTKAEFYIKRVSNVEEDDFFYLDLNEHKQFFQRINYFLDIKKEWPRCISKDEKIIFKTFCSNISSIFISSPKKSDKNKKQFIYQRVKSKDIIQMNNDILLIDNFSILNKKNEILNKYDRSISKKKKSENINLNKGVNIDDVLDKIKKEDKKILDKK